jgi:acyl-CoA reductase-like NAD-dependent aldehyde dehydrogenase
MLSPILVAGEWRRGRGDVYASRYPADNSVNAELAAANIADVEEAIEAALPRGTRRSPARRKSSPRRLQQAMPLS